MKRRSRGWTDPFLEAAYSKSHITKNAQRRRLSPTRAEAELEKISRADLNGLELRDISGEA